MISAGAVAHMQRVAGGGGPPPGGDPDALIHYSALAIVGASDNDPVVFDDISGHANHSTQTTTGNRPRYDVDAFGAGLPGVRFNVSGSQFLHPPDVLSSLSEGEIFVVAMDLTESDGDGFWHLGTAAQSSHWPWLDGVIYEAAGSTTRHTVGNPSVALTTPRLYNVVTSPTEYTVRLDTATLYTTGTNTVGFSSNPRLGISDAGGTFFFDGWYAEFRVYATVRTAPQRAAIEAEMKATWGLTGY